MKQVVQQEVIQHTACWKGERTNAPCVKYVAMDELRRVSLAYISIFEEYMGALKRQDLGESTRLYPIMNRTRDAYHVQIDKFREATR